jgi:hypothetical protein
MGCEFPCHTCHGTHNEDLHRILRDLKHWWRDKEVMPAPNPPAKQSVNGNWGSTGRKQNGEASPIGLNTPLPPPQTFNS